MTAPMLAIVKASQVQPGQRRRFYRAGEIKRLILDLPTGERELDGPLHIMSLARDPSGWLAIVEVSPVISAAYKDAVMMAELTASIAANEARKVARGPLPQATQDQVTAGVGCRSSSDGDCAWVECPQHRDHEPHTTGRHCPLDTRSTDED